jgi:hypothetical protein
MAIQACSKQFGHLEGEWKDNDEGLLVAKALEVCSISLGVSYMLSGLEGTSASKITRGSNEQCVARIKDSPVVKVCMICCETLN